MVFLVIDAFTIGLVVATLILGLFFFAMLSALQARRQVPREGRFLEVDGARLHYVEMGAGRPIVLVHGLACDLHSLTYALTQRLSAGFRVIAVDRPGAGYSVMGKSGVATLNGQAAILRRFLRAGMCFAQGLVAFKCRWLLYVGLAD